MKFGVIMEFEEPSLLREILSLRSLDRYITQVTPTIALVKAKDMQKVGELLKSKGYFAEIPQEWLEKKVLFLSREEAILLKKVLEEVKYDLKFPQNTIIDDIIERLDKNDTS
jgi:S-adenosylmethionine:diacylglycerol 3-amino-3-carboxypropyl transferase